MGILNIFKKDEDNKVANEAVDIKVETTEDEAKPVVKAKSSKTKANTTKVKSTIQADKIILSPWATEKATDLQKQNKYSFVVDPKANKIMVALAVRELYGVKPIKVNLIKVLGKSVRYGRTQGMTSGWRKAVVTLKEGDKISLFEGV